MGTDELLHRARSAYERRDWPAAYQDLMRLHEHQALGTDIGFTWFLRGEPTLGSACIGRARRLLTGQPESESHGFLRWLDLNEALEAGDLDTALAAAQGIQDLARRLGSPALTSLGLLGEGTVAVRRGDLDHGFSLLDEAMLPVLAGELRPEDAGLVYCQMIAICCEVADLDRARHWTAATQRWCEGLSSAVMFLGICRLHRVQLLRVAGDWESARDEVATACDELADLNVAVVAEAHYELGELRRLSGDHDGAARAYRRRPAELGKDPEPGQSLLVFATAESGGGDVVDPPGAG